MLVQSKMQFSAWLDKIFARRDLHYWKWIKQTMISELCANHATKTQKWIYWNVIYSAENELSGQCNQQLRADHADKTQKWMYWNEEMEISIPHLECCCIPRKYFLVWPYMSSTECPIHLTTTPMYFECSSEI